MNRRKARENAFIALFAASFGGNEVDDIVAAAREDEQDFAPDAFGEGLLRMYHAHAEAVDGQIEAKLKGWRVDRLHKVSLALLRLAVAEMLYGDEADMDSIIINEAVELSKRFGDEEDYQFVNGVLGSILREKLPAGEEAAP